MVHAVRMARRVVRDRTAVVKLFDEIGPRYLGRPGGYTRIVKIGQPPGRRGADVDPRADPRWATARGARSRAGEPAAKGSRDGQEGALGREGRQGRASAAKAAKGAPRPARHEGTRGAAKQRAKQATGPAAKAKPGAKDKPQGQIRVR